MKSGHNFVLIVMYSSSAFDTHYIEDLRFYWPNTNLKMKRGYGPRADLGGSKGAVARPPILSKLVGQ